MTNTTMPAPAATIADPQVQVPPGEPVRITYDGSPWSLAYLGLINFLLTVVTLGIYSFWGRTEVRKRIWSAVRLNGEPLEYTGRGMELFLGFLIVFGGLLLPIILLIIAVQIMAGPEWGALVLLPFYIILPFLLGLAVYRARRYRLSRTRWRGIRGSLIGSPSGYAWGYYWTMILSIFVLGWLTPWRTNYLYRRMTNNMRFGNLPFQYKGKAGPLYPPYVLAWIGGLLAIVFLYGVIIAYVSTDLERFAPEAQAEAPVTLTWAENLGLIATVLIAGFIYALFAGWYNARTLNYLTNNTRYEGLTFNLQTKGLGLVWLFISNQLISLFTLGILRPVAEARAAKYVIDRLSVDGSLDMAKVAQSQGKLDGTGEGLAEAFDIDAFG